MESLLPRLKELEENLRTLGEFRRLTFEEINADRKLLWGMRYGMLECLQIVIDTACAVVSYYDLGNPKSYGECVQILGQRGYLTGDLVSRLIRAVGLRNILVHEYFNVDDRLVYESLNSLDGLSEFSAQIVEKTG